MPISQTDFQSWLSLDTAIKCTLVEVVANISGTDTTIYLSNYAYTTGAADTPANTVYLPVLKSSLSYSEALPLDGTANLSYGDIAVDNSSGELDSWLNYIWASKSIKIWMGDLRWPRTNFYQIYNGTVSDIGFSDANTINISIRSNIEKANTNIAMIKVGGTSQAEDLLRPLVLGEVHNITPVQIDPVQLIYMAHDGPIERLIEVRDNGVPLLPDTGYIAYLTNGTFRLLRAPAGTITCSVQGEQISPNLTTGALVSGSYSNTVAKLIATLCLKYSDSNITSADLDLQNFRDFDALNTQPVGVYITQESNLLAVCQELASSVGAQFTSTKSGLLGLLKISAPVTDAGSVSIGPADIIRGSFTISQKIAVKSAIKLGYAKNWTVQTQLLTGIPEPHKVMYAKEYYYYKAEDTSVRDAYNLPAEPSPINTLLISNRGTEVQAEAERRLNIWKVPRYIFRFEAVPRYLDVQLGQMINLTYQRFGLSSTKSAQIISLQTDWYTGKVSLEVLV